MLLGLSGSSRPKVDVLNVAPPSTIQLISALCNPGRSGKTIFLFSSLTVTARPSIRICFSVASGGAGTTKSPPTLDSSWSLRVTSDDRSPGLWITSTASMVVEGPLVAFGLVRLMDTCSSGHGCQVVLANLRGASLTGVKPLNFACQRGVFEKCHVSVSRGCVAAIKPIVSVGSNIQFHVNAVCPGLNPITR